MLSNLWEIKQEKHFFVFRDNSSYNWKHSVFHNTGRAIYPKK